MIRLILKSAAKFLARHPRWMVATAILYLVSPWDLLPEALLGPMGYLEDLLVLILPYVILEYAKRVKDRDDVIDTTTC
jgi:uncharacterized membrane protein YkvA (DUF1232 family)